MKIHTESRSMVRKLAIVPLVVFLALFDAALASDGVLRKSLVHEADYLDSMTIKGLSSHIIHEAWYQHRTTKEVYRCTEIEYEFMGSKYNTDMKCKVLSQFAPDDSRTDALALAKMFNAHAYDMRFSITHVLDRDQSFEQVIRFYLFVDKDKNVIACRYIRTNYEFSYHNNDGVEIFIQSDKESVATRNCKQVSK